MPTGAKDIRGHALDIVTVCKQSNRFRQRHTLSTPQGAEVLRGDRRLINFCSNDYLGLANHTEVVRAFMQGAERYGVGSGASHLVCGHSNAHAALEEQLAEFVGRQRAILFSTGYMANLAIVSTLLNRGDVVFGDRLNHASMIDAVNMSRAKLRRYAHGDASGLADGLRRTDADHKLVLTEGVFSMGGDISPLPALAEKCRAADAWLGVDDAHGFGVLGASGAGTVEHFGLSTEEVPVLMATLGKALGCFGAFVAGDETVVEAILQTARTYIYTTAPPAALAVAAMRALDLLGEENWRREYLQDLIRRFRKEALALGIPVSKSMTPIQPLIIGTDLDTLAVSQALLGKGFLITAIRPPTVPEGTARLRITLTASHSEQQVADLLEALASILCK